MGRSTSGNIFNVPLKSFAGTSNALIATGSFHNFIAKPSFATPAGANISHAGENVSINFSSVTVGGTTSYTTYDPTDTGLTVPAGYELKLNAPAYNLSTTAATSGDYTVCMKVPSASSAAEFNSLRILHGENGSFVNRTWSLDLRKRQICANVNSPGLFVVAQMLAPTSAEVKIAGRVTAGKAIGVSGAIVYLTDVNGATRMARTNPFGYYSFDEVPVGTTIIVSVVHKRYQFETQVINVSEDLMDLDFSPVT